jgi:hypothetical protein
MTKPYDFWNAGADLYHLLNDVEKYKAYVATQTDTTVFFTANDIISGNGLSMFGAEIFQFWIEARRVGSPDKSEFILFADKAHIPIRDRDLGPDELSWAGRAMYAVWCAALIES